MQLYQSVDTTIQNNDNESVQYTKYQKFLTFIGDCLGFAGTYLGWFCCYPYKTVDEGCHAGIKEFGKLTKIVGPGMYYINPETCKIDIIDTKLQVIDINRQTVMSKDNVTLNIDGVVYYQIKDIKKSIYGVSNIREAVIQLTFTTLRDVIGRKTLQEVLEHRDELAKDIYKIVESKGKDWGVEISSIQLKDIHMTDQLQQALSAAAQAKRHADAKMISAQADVESAKLMRQASDILDSEGAMQIRYLETIGALAKSSNAKIIFLPSDYKQSGKPSNLISQVIPQELQ